MSITEEKLNLLRQIIGGAPKKIALLSHKIGRAHV